MEANTAAQQTVVSHSREGVSNTMFQDPDHADVQTLAAQHAAGSGDQVSGQQAADAIAAFHANADPQLVKQVTDEHYESLPPDKLQGIAAGFHKQLLTVAGSSPEAMQLAQIDPATATPQQVSEMHHYIMKHHPELMRDLAVGGAVAGGVALGALAAFAASRYLKSRGS